MSLCTWDVNLSAIVTAGMSQVCRPTVLQQCNIELRPGYMPATVVREIIQQSKYTVYELP